MKKVILVAILILTVVSFAYATIIEIGGGSVGTKVSYTPVNKTHSANISAETDKTVWTPASGKSIVLVGISYWADVVSNFYVETGSTTVVSTMGIGTASATIVIGNGTPIWKGSADEALTYTTSTASKHSITMWGYEE